MEIINRQNLDEVRYFELSDYIEKINIQSSVLQHMEETNKEFDKYMKKLGLCDINEIIHFWLIQMAEEMVNSNQIEKHYVKIQDILKENLFFETLKISHKRIHDLHNFVLQNDLQKIETEYRNVPIRVSAMMPTGEEVIYWHGPKPEDVPKFMNAFLEIYKSNDMSVINSNPFLKSALLQLLFIRIHPYRDGNGRTSRILHSIKFTESINKIYNMKLKLSPLNLSGSILINQFRYVNILDSIYFDMDHDNNENINKWFEFILNMVDEQLYFLNSRFEKLRDAYLICNGCVNNKHDFDQLLYQLFENDKKSYIK